MPLFLDKIDAAPLSNTNFTFEYNSWVAVLVDTLNEIIQDIQDAFNLLPASGYTSTQIASMFAAGDLVNGVLLYDSTNNEYVGVQSGALVKFTTTAYP